MRGLVLATALLVGCSEDDGLVCATIARPGIELRIATTAVCSTLKVVIRQGSTIIEDSFASVMPGATNECVFTGAYERVGTFSVDASAPGYRPATVDAITVTKTGGCNVSTTKRTVALEPER